MRRRARLSVDAAPANLPRIADFLTRTCRAWRVSEGALFDCLTAVDEACTNVIKHAYQGRGGPLEVELELREGTLRIGILDQGGSFDAEAVRPFNPQAEPAQMLEGALGLFLIENLMDEVRYQARPSGNRLEMIKRDALHASDG